MIDLKDLSFAYRGRQPLFESLNLQLAPGQIYALLGCNGVGKTTLLQILCGLLFPNSGQIEVMSYEPKGRRRDFLAGLFYLAEEHYIPPVRIRTLLRMYALFYPKFDRTYFAELLQGFKLEPDWKLPDLSYGQQRKAMIAFALATRCQLLLLDEPVKGLDIPSRGQFRELLSRSVMPGQTLIISTHQIRDLHGMTDSLVILDQGRILLQESIEEIERRVCLQFQVQQPDPGDCLYYEHTPGGYLCLQPAKREGRSLEMDLEILFNAATAQGETFRALFQKTPQYEIH